MSHYTKTMRSWLYHSWYWLVILVCVLSHFILGLFTYLTPNPMKNHRKLARFFIQIIARAMKLKVSTHGLDAIPTDRPLIFMANHTSLIDILVMVIGLPYHFNFIAKKELFWVPFIGLDMVMGGDFLINRNHPASAKKCLKRVATRVKKGWNILIFPEGTRSVTGELLPFKRGAFKLAIETGALIVPSYIQGSHQIVKKNTLHASPGHVHIHFSAPIDPATFTNPDSAVMDAMQQTRAKILDLTQQANTPPSSPS